MKVSGSFRFIGRVALTVGLLSLAQCRALSHTAPTPTQTGSGEAAAGGDFIRFLNAPNVVKDGHNLSVEYLCSQPCMVQVEVLASFGGKTGVAVFRRKWARQKPLATPRTHSLVLRFPDSVAYRRDFFIRHTVDAHDVMLRAWLHHTGGPGSSEGGLHDNGSYHLALARTVMPLATKPPSLRLAKQHHTCLSWGAELMWVLTNQAQGKQCPQESGLVELLKFPLASTGERFGMIHRFSPFINTDLDQHRLKATSNPRLTLSMWIYLLSWCGSKLCGIIQHVDHNNTFISPLILLTNTGDIVFQVRLTSGEDEAFRSHTALRLRTWYRLDCFIEGSMVILKISSTQGRRIRQHNYIFHNHIHLNDTDGYFVIGGGKYMPGINGYFGPIRYHRLKAKEVLNPLLPKRTLILLDETHRMCGETREAISAFLRALKESQQVTNTRMCRDLYTDLDYRFGRQVCRAPPWGRRAQKLYRPLLEFLQTEKPEDLSRLYGLWDRRGTLHIGARVFTLALRRLTPGDPPVFGGVSVTSLLELSCCLGYHRAAYLLAVIHLAGLGVPTDTVQGHVYSLIGAQADDRLALMHLGYKHTQGIDGFPEDFAMAYSYYGNVGQQTCADRWNVQSTKQYTAEHVLLTDDEALGYQTHQTDDIFQYLQFQAERGDISSQKTLARMLFWGQQGVSKDPGAAVKWFAKTAMEMGDAHSMYDYSILLFKGQGVKKNTTLALQLMQKAASEGLLEALNGMGWYYSHFMADAETALKYFEKAAKNGSRDAVYNLGVFHLNGNYMGKPGKNETAAFLHFLKAGLLGHYDATVLAAWYYATGNLQVAPQDTERAVWMLKHMSEKNGYLGHVLQKGLRAYLRGSRDKALLSYTIAAETGLSVAQTNAAHLCEELGLSYGCERRYYNYSTFNNLPHHTGFLKMGDYHYQGWRDSPQDLRLAISMYGRAGQHGSAQGIFNLAVLMEEGHRVPEKILEQLNISVGDLQDVDVIVEKLYKSCSQLDEDLDLSPCSLALFRVRLGRAWRSFMHHPVQSLLAYVIGSASVAALVTFVMQRVSNSGPAAHGTIQRAEPSPANHDEVIRNGQLGLVTQLLMRRRNLHLIGDWAITVMGVGLCTAYTLLLFHLL